METVIQVEKLFKSYRIGHLQKERYVALRDVLAQGTSKLVKKLFRPLSKSLNSGMEMEDFFALSDVGFEVKQGERLGIIGRNGAGKSTLLKILSRITEPTKGRIRIRGRVASLLEVGTGFHSELTGRENIFLNGSILGMSRREIKKKFDEIVEFSEVEKFLDTPVKRYSSGMYVRLAFAVAAHLEPEILIIDEVLAVGDLSFQKKCLGKMEDVSRKEGRTVLFVSHNMGLVQEICSRAILLSEGKIVKDGNIREVVHSYLNLGMEQFGERVWEKNKAPGDEYAKLHAVRVLDKTGRLNTQFTVRDPIFVELEYEVFQKNNMDVAIFLYNEKGDLLFMSLDKKNTPFPELDYQPGFYKSRCMIPGDFLTNTTINVMVALTNKSIVHTIQRDIVSFTIGENMEKEGARGQYQHEWPDAAVRPDLKWIVEYTNKK